MNKSDKQKEKQEGYGNCSDCVWHNQPEGCNVKRDSEACKLNKKLKTKDKIMINKALEAVEELNQEVYEYFESFDLTFPLFELKTDGSSTIIEFMGQHQLWDLSDDEREFYEDKNEYESLKQYLRREAQEIIDQISGIKL